MSIRNFTVNAITEILCFKTEKNYYSGRGDEIGCEVLLFCIKHMFSSVCLTVALMLISWL